MNNSPARQFGAMVLAAVLAGTGMALTGAPAHEAVRYGIAVATGMLIAFGLARR